MSARADHIHAPIIVIAGCLLASACDTTIALQVGVSEQEAARSAAILDAHHIGSQRAAHGARPSEPTTFDLRVSGADVANACIVLGARHLHTDAESSPKPVSAFIPTPAEERARAIDATAAALEHTLALWGGVTDVRVLITTPPPASLGATPGDPRAAVTLAHLPGQAPDTRAIRALVRHVVGGSDDSAILVSLIEAPPAAKRQLVQVGPIAVTSATAPLLKLVLALLLTLTTTLAGLLLWTMWKARQARG